MTKMIIMFISLNFLLACLAFTLNNKHLLSTLLSLEFIMLNLFMCIFIYLNNNKYEMYLLMMLLTMMVCEGALGLAILVSMVRTHGNEFFQSFNIMC